MTLRNARNIQYALAAVILLAFLPFGICYLVFGILYSFCEKMMDCSKRVAFFFGHYLLLHSDEVKDGTIQNQDVLKHGTASTAFRRLMYENSINQN